jgi:hypothetical protein
MDVDPDDEVVGARGTAGRANRPRADLSQVPKVTDEAGDQIMGAFIGFLEKYHHFFPPFTVLGLIAEQLCRRSRKSASPAIIRCGSCSAHDG